MTTFLPPDSDTVEAKFLILSLNTSNTFDIVVGENATADYTFYCKVENMKMIEGDYDVKLSQKFISHFQNTKLPIQYWIALEQDSKISK